MTSLGEQIATSVDLARVLAVLPGIEARRLTLGIEPLLALVRQQGLRKPERRGADRTRLRRAIGWLDSKLPDGGNCYRRVLLEIALDSGAAREPVGLGLRRNGGAGSGHAWLGDRPAALQRYDVELVL